jgi:CheY-like chemotaxis protein
MNHGALAKGDTSDVAATRGVSVVVADDNQYFRDGMVRSLARRDDIELLAAVPDGARALEAIRQLRPDVALVDARMPLLDGLGLAAMVTTDPELSGTMIVLLSARADAEMQAQALAAGAVAFLDKTQPRRRICDVLVSVVAERHPR